MRGFVKAGLLLVPALVSAFIVPDSWDEGKHHDQVKDDKHNNVASRTIHLAEVGSQDVPGDVLTFQVDVLPSTQICGVGNVIINGQELKQGSRGDGSSGKGEIIDHKKVISANWDFDCLRGVKDEPSAQFMKFTIESIDGRAVEDLAFSMMFQQAPIPEIVMISPDLAVDTPAGKLPEYPSLSDEEENEEPLNFEEYNFEQEIDDVNQMKALVLELQFRIDEKEQEISFMAAAQEFDAEIGACDSLKCLLKASLAKARKLAYKVKHKALKISGHLTGMDEHGGHGRPPHHFKPPHWRKPHFRFPGKHGNHSHHNKTCHRPHRNGSHPHPPHWRRPHFRLPPKFCHKFCHPPPHHKPPHGGPPHHGPPHHGPPKDHHDGPPRNPNDGPPKEGGDRHGRPDNQPLSFEDEVRPQLSLDYGPPRDQQEGPSPPHRDFRDFRHGHRRPHWVRALHVLKFIIAGVLLSLLTFTIRRRCCNSARRQAKAARKEERHRRRAYRRAARKQAWKSWIQRHFRYSFNGIDEELEYEEKYGSLAPLDSEDNDDVASEIQQLQSAASVVSDIVAAEEGRANMGRVSMESRTTSLPGYGSVLGDDGEELPQYQESDGSEESSAVADGFRYTPGSSEYTPGHSPNISETGSVRDVLGDTKD